MKNNLPDIYNLLQEIAWHFGNHGFNGECCEDLSLVEFMALKKTYESDNLSIQELGNALGFTKSGGTRIVDRLEDKGYIIRQRSPIDGRVCCITVTAKGKEVINKIIGSYTSYLEDVLKGFEYREVENIREVLEKLVNAVRQNKPVNSTTNAHNGGDCV